MESDGYIWNILQLIQFTTNKFTLFGWKADHCFGVSLKKEAQVVRQLGHVPMMLPHEFKCIMQKGTLDKSLLDSSMALLHEASYSKRAG